MAFLIKNHGGNQGKSATPQELKMVCGESNEINVEKIVLCSTAEKNYLLLIRSEKIVRLSWESKNKVWPRKKL